MRIGRVIDIVSDMMKNDLKISRHSLQEHALYRGISYEAIFGSFLQKYLPKSLELSQGFIVDTKGNLSKQMDIIIYDSAKTPVFFQSGSTRIIPVECVYSVVEVKGLLTTFELGKIFENMKSARKLKKSAYFTVKDGFPKQDFPSHELYGKKWPIWPIQYYVFAFESKVNPLNIIRYIKNKIRTEKLSLWRRIDTICILEKGLITNLYEANIMGPTPDRDSQLTYIPTRKALFGFYSLMMDLLTQVQIPHFKFTPYAQRLRTWRV